VALMGVGLALDRPLDLRRPGTWRAWGATWRLLGIAMPLSIAGVALVGWWVMGLAPAAAVLLGAVLAPTDPVLASDVQVEGPTTLDQHDLEDEMEIDERDEVRFALTSEAGLNDGLAFPFVYFAILMATTGAFTEWGLHWLAWELVGKIVVGVAIGTAVGWGLAKVAFRSRRPSLRLAETGEPLLALAAILLSYGVAEVAGGYGFLSVFACGMTLRSAERGHDYHVHMHAVIDRLERLLTLAVLLFLGVAMTNGLLSGLTWQGAAVGACLVFVLRPLAGWLALAVGRPRPRVGSHALGRRECRAAAWLGVRGVGSLYYIAYALIEADFGDHPLLWSTVAFTVALSVLVHGVAATPIMRGLDRARAV
jgi:sodium/hydrogen antiporter